MALHHPGVHHRDRHEAPHPVRAVEREPEAEPRAPVMADHIRPVDAQSVEDGDDIGDPGRRGVAADAGHRSSRTRANRARPPSWSGPAARSVPARRTSAAETHGAG